MIPQNGTAQEHVSFPTQDGGVIYADVYGKGDRAVVLAHGVRFDKSSWEKQARRLAESGFRALAFDFRGYGNSRGGPQTSERGTNLRLDVLAAVRYLHQTGAKSVSVIGGSMGGGAAAEADVEAEPGEIERLVLLAHVPINNPERLKGRKLFAVSSGDSLMKNVREQYDRAPDPKQLFILDGPAHAQAIFATEQGERLMQEILRFLSEP
jgi:pimeloyl-ACP methyl ester carboxylesterase